MKSNPNKATTRKKHTIMVSSTVYGIKELLDRIYTLLTAFDYDVWMSHKGTVPMFSYCSAFKTANREAAGNAECKTLNG